MAFLPLGKLTILVGAGLVGSVLAKEGRGLAVTDFVSGAFKFVAKQLKQDDSGQSVSKPRNDSLLAQVNSLRQELQFLTANRPITIVTGTGTGAKKYGMIIIVVAVGYGYVWWKGWKLPDLMFVTKRSLSDACNNVAKQLEGVYMSISKTERQLDTKITSVDDKVNKIVEISQVTQEEVTLLRGRSKLIGDDFESVRDVVQTLENKLIQIEGKQDETTQGVKKLCDFVWNFGNSKPSERIQGSTHNSFRASIEPSAATPSRTGSLPPLPYEPPSPTSSNGSMKAERLQKKHAATFGLKDFNGVPELGESSSLSPGASNGIHTSEETITRSSSSIFQRHRAPAVLTRQRSATGSLYKSKDYHQIKYIILDMYKDGQL